ncbi:hypothetical protein NDU88_004148 [Pleurodeles waltl]|uniref:Uncharacterized protein n=1 Tax=Pleurodeles waltl TaxID=8319 RepID=A0AAV7M7I3_PLEWA|nr:hypothetical protein NDU88_004148 [Pleurodeles waltl]
MSEIGTHPPGGNFHLMFYEIQWTTINDAIRKYFELNTRPSTPPHMLWDGFKAAIHGVITFIAIARAREACLFETRLTDDIKKL